MNGATHDNKYHPEQGATLDDEVNPMAQPGLEEISTVTPGNGKFFAVMRASH